MAPGVTAVPCSSTAYAGFSPISSRFRKPLLPTATIKLSTCSAPTTTSFTSLEVWPPATLDFTAPQSPVAGRLETSARSICVSPPGPARRTSPVTTLIADVQAPIGGLLFVNHLPNWQLDFEFERELQALAAARAIEEMLIERKAHVVLAGDFDADPAAASIRFWSGRQSLGGMSVCYRDAWESQHPNDPGHTFTPRNPQMRDHDWPFRRIDYIFVRCLEHGGPSLQISTCGLAFDEPVNGIWASDHFGVLADLQPLD
jgi:endonuclease/exonuclease/phosphatase family metal-dependent hydrolase